jgi:predicted ATPase
MEIALSGEQGAAQWLARGTILRGWALAWQGQGAEGLAQMCQGLSAFRATGAERTRTYFLALLAEGYRGTGGVKEGLRVLAEALTAAHNSGERYCEAELHRLKGDLLLLQSADQPVEAEACFHQALAIARRQQATSWELRAAMSLSRLWQRQGKWAAAHELLAPIYGWFTEGFDTADLQDAKALLEELSRSNATSGTV